MSCKALHIYGDDMPYDSDSFINNSLIFVTDYDSDIYDGRGYALVQNMEGAVELYNLSHCSCYGPLDSGPILTWKSVEDFINDNDVLHQDYNLELKEKFIELVNS